MLEELLEGRGTFQPPLCQVLLRGRDIDIIDIFTLRVLSRSGRLRRTHTAVPALTPTVFLAPQPSQPAARGRQDIREGLRTDEEAPQRNKPQRGVSLNNEGITFQGPRVTGGSYQRKGRHSSRGN